MRLGAAVPVEEGEGFEVGGEEVGWGGEGGGDFWASVQGPRARLGYGDA